MSGGTRLIEGAAGVNGRLLRGVFAEQSIIESLLKIIQLFLADTVILTDDIRQQLCGIINAIKSLIIHMSGITMNSYFDQNIDFLTQNQLSH